MIAFYLKKKMSHSVISPYTSLSISSDTFDYFFSIIVIIKFGQTIVWLTTKIFQPFLALISRLENENIMRFVYK